VAKTKFEVEVLSPEGEVWSGEVEMVSTRTATGSIGLLANHTPLLAMLDPTELRLYESESDITRFAQGEGYLQVGGNRALLLVEEAHTPDELDASDLHERLQRAEQELESCEEGSEQQRVAQRDRQRWKAFLEIAEGPSS
jgi:F-type H+-transporting ATPase subunit epsilon